MRCWTCGRSAHTRYAVLSGRRTREVAYEICADCANKRRWLDVVQE